MLVLCNHLSDLRSQRALHGIVLIQQRLLAPVIPTCSTTCTFLVFFHQLVHFGSQELNLALPHAEGGREVPRRTKGGRRETKSSDASASRGGGDPSPVPGSNARWLPVDGRRE
eukprot:759894-Hanusia_phi.AAC.1